jgi:hypothetical protein
MCYGCRQQKPWISRLKFTILLRWRSGVRRRVVNAAFAPPLPPRSDLLQFPPRLLAQLVRGSLVVAGLDRVGERRRQDDPVLSRDLEDFLDLALVEAEDRVRAETEVGSGEK